MASVSASSKAAAAKAKAGAPTVKLGGGPPVGQAKADVAAVFGGAREKAKAGTIATAVAKATPPTVPVDIAENSRKIKAGTGVVHSLQGLDANAWKVITLENVDVASVFGASVAKSTTYATVGEGAAAPMGPTTSVAKPPVRAATQVLKLSLADRIGIHQTGLCRKDPVSVFLTTADTMPTADLAYVRPAGARAGIAACPAALDAIAANDAAFDRALEQYITATAGLGASVAFPASAVAIYSRELTAALAVNRALRAGVTYGDVVLPGAHVVGVSQPRVEACAHLDSESLAYRSATTAPTVVQTAGDALARAADLGTVVPEAWGPVNYFAIEGATKVTVVSGVQFNHDCNLLSCVSVVFNGHAVECLAECTAATGIGISPLVRGRGAARFGGAAAGESEVKLLAVWGSEEVRTACASSAAQGGAMAAACKDADITFLAALAQDYMSRTKTRMVENGLQLADQLRISSAPNTLLSKRSTASNGKRLLGAARTVLGAIDPSSMAGSVTVSGLIEAAAELVDSQGEWVGASAVGFSAEAAANAVAIAGSPADASTTLGALRRNQVQHLQTQQSAARGGRARAEARKQKIYAEGNAYVSQVYVAQHSTARCGMAVGLVKTFSTASAQCPFEMVQVFGAGLEPLLGRRLSGIPLGDGFAGEAALLSLAEQLGSKKTGCLSTTCRTALHALRTAADKHGVGASSYSAFVCRKPAEAVAAGSAVKANRENARSAATLVDFCEKQKLELSVLTLPAIDALAEGGIVDEGSEERVKSTLDAEMSPSLISTAILGGVEAKTDRMVDNLSQAVIAHARSRVADPKDSDAVVAEALAIAAVVSLALSPSLTAGVVTPAAAATLAQLSSTIAFEAAAVVDAKRVAGLTMRQVKAGVQVAGRAPPESAEAAARLPLAVRALVASAGAREWRGGAAR
ncbi:unnamed protein product [Prorocentrum cordatum]|uniref:Uncharacterized protein n=1 Tax=Prorocentrum cordatum TaxID=2364126 RepID=A0ABN9WRZ8_9DINO|nr:unnamed protein product [Polarella glacialis]